MKNKTLVMGVLNITPNSFSDAGKFYNDPSKAVEEAVRMHLHGADIIDIGGESIRIGAQKISAYEEIKRILPVIKGVKKILGQKIKISIDTYKSEVAEEALKTGADIINDVSGLQIDSKMAGVVTKHNSQIVITYLQNRLGITKNRPENVMTFFTNNINSLKKAGVSNNQIILDPGFGFFNSTAQNFSIIKNLSKLKIFQTPLLIAISRKATLGKFLKQKFKSPTEYYSDERLSSALATTAISVINGANIVRTHDVYETKNFLLTLDELLT